MLALQISNEAILGMSFIISLIVAVVISLIVYFMLRKGNTSIRSQFQQITSDFNNLRLNLPRYEEVKEMKDRLKQMEEQQNNFTGSLSNTLDSFKRSYSEEIDTMRTDTIRMAENKSIEVAKMHVETTSVSREEFDRLRERIERLLGAEELAERLQLLSSIFDSKNIKTLVWQCKLIRLTERGLAPDAEEDLIVQAGIPLSSTKSFLKNLEKSGIVDMKKVESYYLMPEYTWLLSYIENPDWLQQRIENYVKKEEEYQKYIRENANHVEEGMIVLSEQFEVASGRIDILCRDKNGVDVVLELKYPAASTEVVGQILRYREDYKRRTANQNMRFILVAPKISDKLKDLLSQGNFEYKEIMF
jgi:hypothetical protein